MTGLQAVEPASAQDYFQNLAAKYERAAGGSTHVIAKHLASLASPIAANAKILDNASGTGIVIDRLLSSIPEATVRETLRITAVDVSSAMLDVLNAKVENTWKIPVEHVHTEALAAENLEPLPANEFDLSFANFGFHLFKDPHRAATHVYRTLAPGGRAFITTWADLGYMKAINAAAEAIRPGKPGVKLPHGDEWFMPEHLENLFRNAGFEDVEVHQKESVYTVDSSGDLAKRISEMFEWPLRMHGWEEGEVQMLSGEIERALQGYDKEELGVEEGQVRLRMVANIAVCRK